MSASSSVIDSAVRVLRATLTNQLARVAPQAYVRLTGQTGRGAAAEEGAADIARYFQSCIDDYAARLGVGAEGLTAYLSGKTLLEYGPGDLPGVAALMVAHGAEKVYCVDRFPLVRLDDKNTAALRRLIESTQGKLRERLLSCLRDPADPGAGFSSNRIEYLVRPSGLSGLRDAVDLVYSRAVLEHVNDLPATLSDMVQALRPGGTAVHLVDLRSHGLHRSNPLDFLAWAEPLWRLMYSEKGVPNRLRINRYRELLQTLPVQVQQLEATKLANTTDVAAVRPLLAAPFRGISDEDLRWLGFWLVMTKKA